MKTIHPYPSRRLAVWLALPLAILVPIQAAEEAVAASSGVGLKAVESSSEADQKQPIDSLARRKEDAAILALLRAKRAADIGGTAAQADLLEARVAVRLARQEVRDEQATSTTAAPEVEATRQQLWADLAAARTPAERREATVHYTEYQRMVHEQKTAATLTEDKK